MSRPPADWISLSEAAELLAASNVKFAPGTIGHWARMGRLQTVKVGHRRYVRRTQVRSLLRPEGATHVEEGPPGLFEDLDF
jgi:hypothetical protein